MIVSGELGPGQKISEKDLCVRFDVSRTPVREALKTLAVEGMVDLLPQRGARVMTITERELNELFPINCLH
jgi:DNA-binding GntR family transcriptional regulator